MLIETKLDVGSTAFFMCLNQVRQSKVVNVDTYTSATDCKVVYTLKENPAGGQYTTRFSEEDVFKTKESLLESL